jgi:pimeloyl-ACP methyl ester carboxylesterase
MDAIVNSQYIKIQGANIHYLEAGELTAPSVLFLHGASFIARTWQEIGTLELLAEKGYRSVAVDLPGYGNSQSLSGWREEFLLELLEKLNLNRPIVVSPSMSGAYSFPFLVNYPEKLRGFVPVAPVGILNYRDRLKGIEVLTLAIWGSNDRTIPVTQADLLVKLMPNVQKVILENAGHACYMRATNEFHKSLIKFCDRCFSS